MVHKLKTVADAILTVKNLPRALSHRELWLADETLLYPIICSIHGSATLATPHDVIEATA